MIIWHGGAASGHGAEWPCEGVAGLTPYARAGAAAKSVCRSCASLAMKEQFKTL